MFLGPLLGLPHVRVIGVPATTWYPPVGVLKQLGAVHAPAVLAGEAAEDAAEDTDTTTDEAAAEAEDCATTTAAHAAINGMAKRILVELLVL